MISGHESGMFPNSIFLLVEDEWVKDCIEGLIGYCRHIQHDWWRSSALGSRMSPVTTDNEKKLSIRRLHFGLHVRVGTYITEGNTSSVQ